MGALQVFTESAWWHWSYLTELLLCVAITVAIWAAVEYSKPFCGVFDPLDPRLSFPHSHSTMFPSNTIPLISFVGPVVWALLTEAILRLVVRSRPAGFVHTAHALVLSIAEAVMVAMCITNPLKNFAGRPRPDYVSRLVEFADFNPRNYTQADLDAICSSDNSRVMDGRRSFPSGHTSMTFAGWTVTAMFVYARLFNGRRTRYTAPLLNVFVVLLNIILPAIVAVSRTRDYRHNHDDIMAGMCIGVLAGVVCFHLHFSLSSEEPRNRKMEQTHVLAEVDSGTSSPDETQA
eukprot:TRINITY_DN6123_c0_g1_i1.p1 TRINITY_DN6123_c0_g1~~TRINITY_DN6123_c0_g1_i1.p1  ORF type:complete len:290 (+),score=81.05 TRINITY_DN6123_c0_g1_i1:73-942(+)